MSMSDPIADMLTRIRNAQATEKVSVMIPASKVKRAIAQVLKDEGYIEDYADRDQDGKAFIEIGLKYYAGTATVTFSVACALRMRVSMSAMGSLMLIRAPYQLALIIPGISPRMAISRILLRASPNLRNVPRGRPVMAQRLRSRTGDSLRGSACSFARASSRASSVALGSRMIASSCLRFSVYFFTVASRFAWRLMTASLAIKPSQS